MRRLNKPIREVVETLLRYEFGDQKVFRLMGTGVKPGDLFSSNEEASLDNPSSLEMPGYIVYYIHKTAGDRENSVNIVKIRKHPKNAKETLLSECSLKLMGDIDRIEEGYHRLEDALKVM